MEQAERLLREGKANVTQIAYSVGFSDQTYFSTVFKQYYGKTTSALTLTPQLAPVDGASLAYRFHGPADAGKMKVKVVFSTVMPFVKGGHDVELAFTGCRSVVRNLNKDMNWQHCYELMYPAGAARVIEIETELEAKPISSDLYELKLVPLTPGIVLQRLVVTTM